jgi:hypothetical protein
MRDDFPWNPQFHRRCLLKAVDSPCPILRGFMRRTNAEVIKRVMRPMR